MKKGVSPIVNSKTENNHFDFRLCSPQQKRKRESLLAKGEQQPPTFRLQFYNHYVRHL